MAKIKLVDWKPIAAREKIAAQVCREYDITLQELIACTGVPRSPKAGKLSTDRIMNVEDGRQIRVVEAWNEFIKRCRGNTDRYGNFKPLIATPKKKTGKQKEEDKKLKEETKKKTSSKTEEFKLS